jgi:hypothetical protein
MLKHTFLTSLIVAITFCTPAFARYNFLYRTPTNDGQILGLETNTKPIEKNGWVVFKYFIWNKNKSNITERVAVTSKCGAMKLDDFEGYDFEAVKLPTPYWAKNQKDLADLSLLKKNIIDSVGSDWTVVVNNKVLRVKADSDASKIILNVVCSEAQSYKINNNHP